MHYWRTGTPKGGRDPVTIDEIRQLVELVKSSEIAELEIARGDDTIRIVRRHPQQTVSSPQAAPVAMYPQQHAVAPAVDVSGAASAGEPSVSNLYDMTAPMVGTFYRASSPEVAPFISVGDRVEEGQTICIIEAMKLMNEIPADRSGTVVDIAVENAQPVEFGQVLIRITPD
jgi:acetyl-CoA carboxylase biotin carboxyl carrier protein